MVRIGVFVALASACVQTSSVECELGGDTWTCPAEALCDPVRVGCVGEDQLHTCIGSDNGAPCTIAGGVLGVCETEICEVSRCGDGVVVAPEECEPTMPGPESSCTFDGYYDDVIAPCRNDCTIDYKTGCVDAGSCGDNIKNGSELCDGVPPALTCVDLGHDAGFLECSSQCGPSLDDCKLLTWSSHVVGDLVLSVDGANDRDVFGVGLEATVTHHDGTTWSDLDVSGCVPAGKRFLLLGVRALGSGKALIAGGEGVIMASPSYPDAVIVSIDGSTCTRTLVAAGGFALGDVWQFSPSDIWAAGTGMFHFDGTSWTSSNTNVNVQKLWASGPSDIYAAGANGLWHYNGNTWSQVTDVQGSSKAVTGLSANDVYVQVDTGYQHWNGFAWSAALPAPGGGILALSSDGARVYAGTYNGVFVLDGTTWSTLELPGGFGRLINGLWASLEGSVFATSGTRVARYPGGALSNALLHGSGQRTVVVDPSTAYVLSIVGIDVFDGSDWHQDTAPPTRPPSTYSDMWRDPVSGILYFAQRASTGAELDRWTAGATPADPGSWAFVANIPGTDNMWGTSVNDLWLLTATPTTTFAHFNGTTVDTTCATCTPGGHYRDIWGTATDVFAVGDQGVIAHHQGSTWSTMSSGTAADLEAVWGSGPTDVYAAGDKTFLHYDGSTWSPVLAPPGRAFPRTLWGPTSNDLFVSTTQGVFHFDGVHWAPVDVTDLRIFGIRGSGTATFFTDEDNLVYRLVRTIDWSN